jgi:phenylalanyl-tRNA synthetase beta subunit
LNLNVSVQATSLNQPRTLKSGEVDKLQEEILEKLSNAFDIKLRA